MTLRDDLNQWTPRLRRYARALVAACPAPSEAADDLVHATLIRALDGSAPGPAAELNIRLYSLLTQTHRAQAQEERRGAAEPKARYGGSRAEEALPLLQPREGVNDALAALKLEEREALLLVVLEGFSYGQAARILKISRAVLVLRLARARGTLSDVLGTRMPSAAAPRTRTHLRLVK